MAGKRPTSVPEPKLARTPFVRGTWPPQPEPMYAQSKKSAEGIKPKAASTRDYGKQPPLGGNTGMTGYS